MYSQFGSNLQNPYTITSSIYNKDKIIDYNLEAFCVVFQVE